MEQDPWVMMTMRSLIPPTPLDHNLRPSARCDSRYPWAMAWKGPLTVRYRYVIESDEYD